MLNSRPLLVTAPCRRIHADTNAGTPYAEGTGLICRIPSTRLILHTLGFSPRGTCAGSWYDHPESLRVCFSRAPGNWLNASYETLIPALLWFSSLRYFPDLCRFTSLIGCQPSPKRHQHALRHRTYPDGNGILTVFPFPHLC